MDVDPRRFVTWMKWYISREAKSKMRKCQTVARKGGQCRTIKYLLRAEPKYSGYDFVLDILLYSYLLI